MKRTALFISMLLTIVGSALADNKLTVDDLSLLPTEEKELAIGMANGDEITAFQFDLTLPAGVTLVTDDEVQPVITKSSRFDATHSVEVKNVPSGAWRFIAYSSKKAAIGGSTGTLFTLKVKAAADLAAGDLKATLSGIVLTKKDKTDVKQANVDVKVTIEPVAAITINNQSREYGSENPTLTYSMTGRLLKGVPIVTTTATKTSGVGNYNIVLDASSVEGPYTVTKGTLTITKAPLTITAKDYTIKQGEALPTFEATYEGFKNSETSAVLTKQPTFSTVATSASALGEYDISVSGAEAQNYEISYVKGKLTIVDADALIITAKSYTIEYGSDIPVFEYTSEGATMEGVPSISCTATKSSPVGTYPIVISKGSVTNYNDTYVNGTLTITKAPLTITAKDYTIKQGEALPTFEATYEGFKNSETSAVLTKQPTITTTATSASDPGEYDIAVTGAESQNYEISYVKGKLTITMADALTVTAKSYTIEYGSDIPVFEYTSEGTTLEGTPSITCTATKSSPVGTYPIVISKGSVTNYNDTYINGTLTITKAPLTITAKDYTIKQGEALPTFEATYEGFKNSETSAVLTKQPTFSTVATSASALGEYDISVSGAEAQNYEISYVKGKLTIVDADALIITANSYTIEYGSDIPVFEYTSEGATIEGTPSITCTATKTSPVGTYPIVISKGSVTNYNDTYVNGTLTITKAPLTITAKNYTIKQGEALPTFEATYEGFKNSETSAVLTKQPTITTTATSASDPGEYDIAVTGAESQNYEISYVKGKLTITMADALTVTAKSYTIEYGSDIPVFEYTSEGATMEGVPSISCTATKSSPVGTYPIVISKGSVTNYNDTYVNGTLTITKAPLTITAKDYTIKQGEALPTFEAAYEGFKNSETSAVLTKLPTFTTTATSGSALGEYDISVSGAEAQNYEISYVKGKLTIVDADALIITANSYTIEYGSDIPVFEYTSEGATIEGTPSITCEATKTSPAGTYDIIISKGSVTNYNVSYVKGKLTITKAPLTITAKDYTIKQGEALPTFEATYEGFKNSETSAVLTKQPTITTTATSTSSPGDYDITVSGAEAQNYEISYVKGKLTIAAQDLIPGDANGDGKVDATDIADIVNYMMGKATSTGKFNEKAADVNGDGAVNAADIVKIVSIIMGK